MGVKKLIVVATKFCYEIHSAESRPPHPSSRRVITKYLGEKGSKEGR